MSTPPPPPPLPLLLPRRSTLLIKLAIIFAVTGVLAFGLCTVGVMNNSNGNRASNIMGIALGAEAICLAGLLTVGVIGLVRIFLKK